MAVLRNKLVKNFTMIPNALITDKKLKAPVFKVICYLFSRPDGWNINNKDVMKSLGIARRETMSSYWKSALESGWINRVKKENGFGYDYILHDSPPTLAIKNENKNSDITRENKQKQALSNKKVTTKSFKKPTVEEIRVYCQERKNSIDPQLFFDSYESKGWMIGKHKMKCWKASVRTWERNNFNQNQNYHRPQVDHLSVSDFSDYQQNDRKLTSVEIAEYMNEKGDF
ncbi:MAG: hypothetical protein HAW67_00460 [Endozoicomonadaceae bacterium]|nr:hypothetical protein [Endozoicomonadaceae bacterium]